MEQGFGLVLLLICEESFSFQWFFLCLSCNKTGHTSNPQSHTSATPPEDTTMSSSYLCACFSRFIVDRFKKISRVSCTSWFLTHFHADHYGGLSGSFNKGTIYCSPPTARLVHSRLKVPRACLVEVELHKPRIIDGELQTFSHAFFVSGGGLLAKRKTIMDVVVFCGFNESSASMISLKVLGMSQKTV